MDWMYLFYFCLALLIFFGAKSVGRGNWNEEYTSLKQTKILEGITALGIALHHMSQKTCAPWHPVRYVVHGLDPFIPMGYMFVAVFLFCSGMGLYKSCKAKPGYLKGFVRRRILPIVIAFYLSEIVYTVIRLLMGEKMDFTTVLWYLSGLHMANENSWYVIVIPFFYLVFWAAFRFCKREWLAIGWVFLFSLAYATLGAFIDHQSDWWMRGEWWYNSIMLFPIGLVFAKHEQKITRVLKKGYWFWLILAFAGFFLLFQQSEWLINNRLGYYVYGPTVFQKILKRLLSAGTQWVVGLFYVAFCFLLMMKVKLGNKVLAWLGAVTLDFYLIHGMFVEFFGYNFLDLGRSIYYIRNVALYIAAVFAATVPATWLFGTVRKAITGLTQKKGPRPEGEPSIRGPESGAGKPESGAVKTESEAGEPESEEEKAESEAGEPEKEPRQEKSKAKRKTLAERRRERREYAEAYGTSLFRRLLRPGIAVIVFVGGYFIFQSFAGDGRTVTMSGLEFKPPDAFELEQKDRYYALWKYTGTGKAGYLVLESDIPDADSRNLDTLEKVYEFCDWLTEREYYTNPHGVRMVRGFTEYSEAPERRYYIEGKDGLLVLRMIENEQYYNRDDCEKAMLQTAESVRPAS